jgi:2',3'-cyclic-nucleotide 2'-phosphodiesterase/3'-nucleotidase/5'-nucleotidase
LKFSYLQKICRKSLLGFMMVALMFSAFSIPNVGAGGHDFDDLYETSRGYDEIMSLTNSGVIKGFKDNTFGPDKKVSREQVAMMMARALDLDMDNVNDPGFHDVVEKMVAYEAIAATKDEGIFIGDLHGYFHPQRNIERGETAGVLVRAFDLEGSADLSNIKDVKGTTFESEISTLYANNITLGKTKTTYGTHDDITRRDFAVLLYNTMELVEDEMTEHKLAIMGTTDIHAHMMPYDYMADVKRDHFGLSKVYSVVEEQRANFDNTLLIDNGDIIQGSILGNMQTIVNDLPEGETNIIIQAMNLMDYDAAALGNHEFNFGLPMLNQIVETSNFPWIGSNIYDAKTDEHAYEPYVMLDHEVDGKDIKVGVLGFVPPQIMIWDKMHLDGEIYVEEIVETAEMLIPQMQEEGADIIVVASHSGIDRNDAAGENASYELSKVDGIDALITGHLHHVFPNDVNRYKDYEGVDLEKGLLNGVPTVMPGAWGSHLGMIELDLTHENGEWSIADGIGYNIETKSYEPHQKIVDLVKDLHEETIAYVNGPVGQTTREMNTYFARVMDNSVVQLVNEAQLDFAEKHFAGTEYENMPVLSAAAPFQAARFGPDYYTTVDGDLAIKDVADIYIYDNTLHIVEVDGNDVKRWLEYSARQFNQIDPEVTDPQNLTNLDFRGFNFDVIEGVEYEIDVTKPLNERIVNLTFEGEALDMDEKFLVVTNNYRASGGGDHLLGAKSVEPVYQGTEENREVIIEYIRNLGTIDVLPSNNWQIAPFEAEGSITFQSSPAAESYIARAGKENFITYLEQDSQGFGVYEYNTEASHPHFIKPDLGEVELTILHTNDIHAAIDPLAKASAYIQAEREEADNSLFLDAGDIFSGNPVVDLEYGKPIIEILNEMNLDAMAIGNHEFDYGQEHFQQRVNESDFTWLSANTEVIDDTIAIEQPDGYVEFDLEDMTVGVLGLTQTPPATAPLGILGLEFHDPIATALEYEHLADEVDVFVALTHIGYSEDRKLADEVDFFDVIIGGHSHSTFSEPQVVNGTPIVQAGSNGRYVGNLTLTFDQEANEVTNVDWLLEATDSMTEVDETVQGIVDYWNTNVEQVLNEVIGYSNTGLTRNGRDKQDVPLGNFWTDAMRVAADADIALTNNGGLRDSISAGDLTKRDIFTVEPFANEILVIEMTGEAIADVIEFSYSRRNNLDLQTSGLNYEILTNELGEFYDSILLLDGVELEADKTYNVAVADYIATGGSGYEFVGEVVSERGLMTDAMINLALDLTANEQAIDYTTDEGRIKISVK